MWVLTVLVHVLHKVGLAFQLPGDLLGMHLLDAALLALLYPTYQSPTKIKTYFSFPYSLLTVLLNCINPKQNCADIDTLLIVSGLISGVITARPA